MYVSGGRLGTYRRKMYITFPEVRRDADFTRNERVTRHADVVYCCRRLVL